MIRGFLLLLLAAALAGCAEPTATLVPRANTLIGNDRLPHAEMEQVSLPRQWALIRNLEYSGYVIMEGRLDDDGRVHITKLVESYPDNSRDQLACAVGGKAVIKAATIGTRMQPMARIYAVFYEKLNDANLAFIYARQIGYTAPGSSGTAAYLNTVTY